MPHTPGPWKLETVRTSVGVCHKIGPLGEFTKIKSACLYDDCYSDKPRDLQLLADAYLIASAPDLLEALKDVLDGPDYPNYNLIREVIRKAEEGK
jgi:hypothetical protein